MKQLQNDFLDWLKCFLSQYAILVCRFANTQSQLRAGATHLVELVRSFYLWCLKEFSIECLYCFVLAIWIAVTSAAILALPPMFEREVQEFSNMEAQEQKKVRALHLLLMYSNEWKTKYLCYYFIDASWRGSSAIEQRRLRSSTSGRHRPSLVISFNLLCVLIYR